MKRANLNTNMLWPELLERCRDNFRLWDIDDYLMPTYRNSSETRSVTVEFMQAGEWRSATCTRWAGDARRNFHALILAFEAVRKADQRGIAGVFAEVAKHFALPAGSTDAHQVLGIGSSASEEEIRSAYRSRLQETHPDKGGDRAEFDKVRSAGKVLGVTS